jgi:hypothetical protein
LGYQDFFSGPKAGQDFDLAACATTELYEAAMQLIALSDVQARLHAGAIGQQQRPHGRAELQAYVDRLARPQIGWRGNRRRPAQHDPCPALLHLGQRLGERQHAFAAAGLLTVLQAREVVLIHIGCELYAAGQVIDAPEPIPEPDAAAHLQLKAAQAAGDGCALQQPLSCAFEEVEPALQTLNGARHLLQRLLAGIGFQSLIMAGLCVQDGGQSLLTLRLLKRRD